MISAIILTKNEEKNIEECISGLKWCNEIIIIDDKSTDNTVKIAKELGAEVFEHQLNNDFSQQRNFGLEKARGDWIFFVDADERVSQELSDEIKNKINGNGKENGFYFKRIDNFLGKWLKHGEIGDIRILRLGRKKSGKWVRRVDEVWEVEGEKNTFDNPLLHYSHTSLDEFITSINERSSLNARMFYEESLKPNLLEWLKPLFKFFNNYILKLGFLDGIQGFVFAVFMSLHSFLVRGKLYLLWKRNEENKNN